MTLRIIWIMKNVTPLCSRYFTHYFVLLPKHLINCAGPHTPGIIPFTEPKISHYYEKGHYGLEGAGIESRWRRDFPRLSRLALRPTQSPVQWVPDQFPGGGVQRSGRGVDHPTLNTTVVKEENSYTSTPSLGLHGLFWSELYLYPNISHYFLHFPNSSH